MPLYEDAGRCDGLTMRRALVIFACAVVGPFASTRADADVAVNGIDVPKASRLSYCLRCENVTAP